MQEEQFYKEAGATAKTPLNQADSAEPQCCGTGCTVCVLDYPELFSDKQSVSVAGNPHGALVDAETLAMLEAIEQAQLQASRLLAETNGDLQ